MTGAAGNRARIEGYLGASGSGKGLSIRQRLRTLKPVRLLIWDARDEYAAHAEAVHDLAELVRRVAAAGSGRFALRYVPGPTVTLRDAFGVVCQLAFRSGRLLMLAEELSDVTAPSWAPPAWRQLTTQGRHRGLHLIGAAQRAAMVDKSFLGCCTLLRVGALGYAADRRAMATELDTRPELVDSLSSRSRADGGADMRMIERDRDTGRLWAIELSVTSSGRVTEQRRPI